MKKHDKLNTIIVLNLIGAKNLLEGKSIDSLDSLEFIPEGLRDEIRYFIYEQTGYDGYPLAGLCLLNGETLKLSNLDMELVQEFFTVNNTDVLVECNLSQDMLWSIEFSTLLSISNSWSEAVTSLERNLLVMELREGMISGENLLKEHGELVSFTPVLRLDKCSGYAPLSRHLNKELSDSGLRRYEVNHMASFIN